MYIEVAGRKKNITNNFKNFSDSIIRPYNLFIHLKGEEKNYVCVCACVFACVCMWVCGFE